MSGLIIQMIALVGILVGAGTSYWTYLQNKRFEIFQLYSKKYNEIISADDIEWWTRVLTNQEVPDDKVCEFKMLAYINLACEEYYLYKTRMIGRKLWSMWEPNIRRILQSDFSYHVREKYQVRLPEGMEVE